MLWKKALKNFHWGVWTVSVFYALWKFKKSSEKHFFSLNNSDFEDGWLFIDRPKDQSDFEWTVLRSTFKKFWPLLLFQVLLSDVLRMTFKNALPFFYAAYSILSLTIIMGEKATLLCIAYIIIAFWTHVLGRKSFCYVLILCALMVKNSSYMSSILPLRIEEVLESFLSDVALTWIMAKSLSFMLDRIDMGVYHQVTLQDFSMVFAYCLYLPAVFTGPILAYDHFYEQLTRAKSNTFKSFSRKVMHVLYILLWYFIYEIMLHYIYSSSIQYYPHVVTKFDSWSLCGLGYALPVMFYLKYFIIYSMALSIAKFECFEFPPPPKCISCIHLSSHLWRTFDKGLYLWILKYLYHPLLLGQSKSLFRKIFALASSFMFVCLWHNIDKAICIWTFLNFLLMSSETLLQSFFSADKRKSYFPTFFQQRRVYAVLGTPHFIMMCISSTFFLSNYEIGVLLFERVVFTGILPLVPILFIMCCGCEVSLDVRAWEKNHRCGYSFIFQKSFCKSKCYLNNLNKVLVHLKNMENLEL